MDNIFDMIAELCSRVMALCEDSVYQKYGCISPVAKAEIRLQIQGAMPALFEGNRVRQLGRADMDKAFFRELENCIAKAVEGGDVFYMTGLLQVLDESLETLLKEITAEYQRDNFSVVLNSNRESTGIGLLPRCSCIWERGHRLSHSYDRLDNFLYHLLMLENDILGEMIDKHFFLPKNDFPDVGKHGRLTIAATPLRLEPHYDLPAFEEERVEYFRVHGHEEHYEEDNELIWQKILAAARGGSDIMVFPEMVGNRLTAGYISGKIKALADEERLKLPALTILPSYYENRLNIAEVIDRQGNILCRQTKQNLSTYMLKGRPHLEAITRNNVVNIFHYEGIGRFAFLICKDFLTTGYLEQIMRCFKLTLIIVPSNSTGSYDFRQSVDLCAHDDCNVVWLNTCAAMIPGKEANFDHIGYVRKRIGRDDDDSQKLTEMPICPGAFEGRCSHDCMFFETIKGV